jgi:hypothetical protein
MSDRAQFTIDPEMLRRARARAAELRISPPEYVRRLLARDLREIKRDISVVFDLVNEGPPTNIARDKDKMIGEAVWQEHRRKTGR